MLTVHLGHSLQNMFLIINQYFTALTNTSLMFTCKLFYGKLGRVMLAMIIVMYHLLAFIFRILLQVIRSKLHISKSQRL